MSQPSACRYIRAVALGLQSVYSKFICMRGSAEKATIKSQFYQLAGINTAGNVEDEDMLILSADRGISDSADRVTEMFQNTPAFRGILGAVDHFQVPSENNEAPVVSTESAAGPVPTASTVSAVESEDTPILDPPEVEILTYHRTSKKSRKRRRTVDDPDNSVEIMKAADLLPLQQEVLFQQMAVFSAQLQLIEEQREYYSLKRQKLLEKS